MKKELIISSSPRKDGNSDLLSQQFAKGAIESGNSAEIVYLREKTIKYCSGCSACFNNRGTCSIKDDMTDLLAKVVAADIIVLATPVYFYTMCGQMKTFIDRTCARYTHILQKEFYYILTAVVGETELLKRTVEEFRGFVSCLDDPSEKGIIYGANAWNIGDIKNTPAFTEAYNLGKQI